MSPLDRATVAWHEAGRTVVYEFSGSIAADLAALRAEVNACRADGGLPPSPVEPYWDGEEEVAP